METTRLRKVLDQEKFNFSRYQSSFKEENKTLKKLKSENTALKNCQKIIQDVSQQIQNTVHQKISLIVSKCLETVFSETYEFNIEFELKRGKTEANIFFERDGMEVNPLTASGGGVVDVASFGLRLACLMLHQPKLRKVLILDEPFKFVSEQYLPNIRILLEDLSEQFDVQFIMITHIKELMTGNVIELGRVESHNTQDRKKRS